MAGRLAVVELCDGLFDDASMFPPEAQTVKEAYTAYLRHRWSWYGGMVGSLACQAVRLPLLEPLAEQSGVDRIEVSMVIPEGVPSVARAVASARRAVHVEIRAIEVPLGTHHLGDALALLRPLVTERCKVFLEVGVGSVTDAMIHQLAPSGVGLKLRLGATAINPFQHEDDLARVLVLCAAERLAFTCSAGVHHAVRHRDADTFHDHHGYLNIALASRIAAATENAAATLAVLADNDPLSVACRVAELDLADVRAIRGMLSSVAAFSITEAVRDLVELGLVTAA